MNATLGLLDDSPGAGAGGGGGGGVPSDGSTTARSILTVSKEDKKNNMGMMSPEVSSSYPVDDDDGNSDDLELGLGLSIGGAGGGLKSKGAAPYWGQYARILTAKDFKISKPKSSISSSSSGTKRTATDSVSPPSGTSVVGWPPIRRAHRVQTKPQNEEFSSIAEENKSTNKTNGDKNYCHEKKGNSNKGYLSVKVNMDGAPIGRKVDLNAQDSYEMLAQTLEDMFCGRRSSTDAAGPSKLLDGTSEFVLTYEDKDGDCMLVGDVPWPMFLSSVKRLRIMRNSDSNGLEVGFQEKNGRRRTDVI